MAFGYRRGQEPGRAGGDPDCGILGCEFDLIEHSTARVCHRNQQVFETRRVFFNIPEVSQALVAGAALPAEDESLAFDVVVQQLCVSHGTLPIGVNGRPAVCAYHGE